MDEISICCLILKFVTVINDGWETRTLGLHLLRL